MLDDYDLGMSNFEIFTSSLADTYQEISIQLNKGWHYLTIVATELVSNRNHSEWHWEYAKDEVRFYVANSKEEVPKLLEEARQNFVNINATAVNLESQNDTDFGKPIYIPPRPTARNVSETYQFADRIPEGDSPDIIDAKIEYNASDSELDIVSGSVGVMFSDEKKLGPHN